MTADCNDKYLFSWVPFLLFTYQSGNHIDYLQYTKLNEFLATCITL